MEEIFMIDPELKKYKKQLEETMAKMINNKPEAEISEALKEELKMKVLARAEELEKEAKAKPSLFHSIRFWQSLSFAAVVAVIALVLVLPGYYGGQSIVPGLDSQIKKALEGVSTGGMNVSREGDRAFGDLGGASQAVSEGNFEKALSSYAPPLGATPQTMSSTRVATGLGGGGGSTASASPDAKMMPPQYAVKYKYVYAGEDFFLPEESQVEVLKRLKGYGSDNLGPVLGRMSFGLMDTSKLSNVKVQYVSLAEDREGGYIADINPYEGIISMYENWQRAVPVDYGNLPQLKESDIPSDDRIIAAADEFIAKYGIDLKNYGAPYVSRSWKLGYAGVRPEDIWIPDVMTVQYPLLFGGKEAWEQGGTERAGFMVNVNIRTMKVASMYGLQAVNFQSSNYAAETDKDRIMKFAAQGDLWPQGDFPAESFQVKEVEIRLGTPTVGYMRYWKYGDTASDELFVPAIIFPIIGKNPADEIFYKQAVVIPLVKEILDNVDQNNNPAPVPYLKSEPSATELPK